MMLKNEDEGIDKKKRKRDMVNAYNDLKGDDEEFSESDEDSEQEEYQV